MSFKHNIFIFQIALMLSLPSVGFSDADTGRQLYETYCAACHGVKGEGDKKWPELNVLGDMTAPPHNETGHTWRHSTEELVKMTLKGHRDPYNETEFLNMPSFEGILTREQVIDILSYLKQWWTPYQLEAQLKKDE